MGSLAREGDEHSVHAQYAARSRVAAPFFVWPFSNGFLRSSICSKRESLVMSGIGFVWDDDRPTASKH